MRTHYEHKQGFAIIREDQGPYRVCEISREAFFNANGEVDFRKKFTERTQCGTLEGARNCIGGFTGRKSKNTRTSTYVPDISNGEDNR